uniref:flagellar filament capping protein FliD n=1 Tax=Eubacterium cellulosolvens TaxID=29322 RepID=UPI000488C89C|nr:flagellar filament capping protein FliD [[Eubacterium] cellulosolvens]
MNVSSTSSSSSSSSLGNTELQGFGGLVSGLNRDDLIEQLTKSTSNKITEQKQAITKKEWQQEAFQNITDKVLALEDDYLTFSSGSSLKDADLYEKSILTAEGSDEVTKYVKASGISDMTDYINIEGVKKLASAASVVSKSMGTTESIQTNLNLNEKAKTSTIIAGVSELKFGTSDATNGFNQLGSFTFPTSYQDENGKSVSIDYTNSNKAELVEQLNKAVQQSGLSIGEDNLTIKFEYSDDKLNIQLVNSSGAEQSNSEYKICADNDVLKALGADVSSLGNASTLGVTFDNYNEHLTSFSAASVKEEDMATYLEDKKLTIKYQGESNTITLLDSSDVATVNGVADSEKADKILEIIQKKVNTAFGKNKVDVGVDGGKLYFKPREGTSNLMINASDAEFRANLGISENASTRINLSGSIYENRVKLGFEESISEEDLNQELANFSINDVELSGITSSTTISELLSKINENEEIGVKATYMSGTNQFALISSSTGSGRTISLGTSDSVANKIFGGTSKDGEDAQLTYSYGNGVRQTVTSSTNTFDLDGLSVTVSGTFGYVKNADGTLTDTIDSSMNVKFTAKANVDSVTESVKKFIDGFNEIATLVNDQIRNRPDRSYKPLTEAQESEMKEKQIENWNEKAKKGLLYDSDVIRNMSNDLQAVFSKLLSSGYNYKDFETIGITFSDDYQDGGQIKFDEEKFKAAMETQPELVSKLIAGDGDKKGLAKTIEDTLTPYATRFATRNGGSYGKLVDEAGSSKIPLMSLKNNIYKQIKDMNEQIENLKTLLKTQQDRYIKQFSGLEEVISKWNTQSSVLDSIYY